MITTIMTGVFSTRLKMYNMHIIIDYMLDMHIINDIKGC